MTEAIQDVDVNVVNPSPPALPVRPEHSSLSVVQISDCAQPALNVADSPSTQTNHNLTLESHGSTDSFTLNKETFDEKTIGGHEELISITNEESGIEQTDSFVKVKRDISNATEELYACSALPDSEYADSTDDVIGDLSNNKQKEELLAYSSVPDSESNLSVSTDETLQNSDSDSFFRGTPDLENMGNQNSNKKVRQSDEDTPDESRTKCCEIPKKKVKDRLSKISRSSKSGEDFDFEADELYPFEGRTKSELEIVDPVELEPFEIIETDDIKFIPGAGTSDVIKSASESKFKTIPEEESFGDEKYDTFIIKSDKTIERERVVLDKGNRILESGTSTAHSTFEFKPAKSKQRIVKSKPELTEPTYENIQPVPECSSGGSRKSSSSSSNEISRKNSKDEIKKPTRQKSKKKSESASDEAEQKVECFDTDKQKPSSGIIEMPQGMSKSLILTQTMFSVPSSQEKTERTKLLNENKNVQQQYENVNVGVKFGPSGITICNTPPDSLSKRSDKFSKCPQGDISKDINTTATPNTQVETPLYETLTSLIQHQSKPQSTAEDQSSLPVKDKINTEQVPPPSPLALEILNEEEDDVEEEVVEADVNEDDLIYEINKRKSEIMEFTENVCKRLSQLLEDQPNTELKITEDGDNPEQVVEHIYETVRKDDQCSEPKMVDASRDGTIDKHQNTDKCIRPPEREDSSSTLKRTSGDSATYTMTEVVGSSDDELPDYFDPKSVQPKRDSEILCDVLDAYSEDIVTAVSAKDVAEIVGSLTLEFGDHVRDHSTNKADKNLALPLKEFDDSFINKTRTASTVDELQEKTPIAEIQPELTALKELAKAKEDVPVQYDNSGRQSVTRTESDLDISEHRDDLSTDSMLADDEDEETMEILFTKTYTEPVEGGEVFLSCTVVNSAYKEEQKKSETWLSDEALEYLEANAADVMSTAFMKAKKEMKDIQICLQSLRKQMEHFHDDVDDISLPDIPVDALSPSDYFGLPRKAVTD